MTSASFLGPKLVSSINQKQDKNLSFPWCWCS